MNPGHPAVRDDVRPAAGFGAAPAAAGRPTPISPPRWSRARTARFQLLGVGLFLALLLRERRYVGGAVLLLIGAALLVKGVAAAVLLKPAVWEHWLVARACRPASPPARCCCSRPSGCRGPRRSPSRRSRCCRRCSTTLLAPDLLFARAPLSLFSWSYGHLLNFNGLTHTVLLVWPLVASAYLFALRGARSWGDPR